MPTLLSINSYFYRRDGSEVVYFDHNNVFEANDWEVIPFSMQHAENRASPWEKYFVDEIEFGKEYSFWEKLRRVPKVVYSFEAKRKLTELLSVVSPDVCHCHSIYHHISPSILGAIKKAGIPLVMTLHDLKIACPAYHMFNDNHICEQCHGGKLYKVVTNRCIKNSLSMSTLIMTEALLHKFLGSYKEHIDRFVSPCQFYIDKLVEWGWDREQFVHIPNPINLYDYTPDYAAGKSILYFGRMSPEKGLLTLLEAAAIARISLRFAGDGPQLPALKIHAKKLNVDATFLGHLENADLIKEIKAARATVLPAEWYENAPMSILESYALGKPVIAADIGGITELLQHEVTGYLYTAGSVQALVDVINSMMELKDTAVIDMGYAARQFVESNYSSEQYHQRMSSLYAELGVAI